MKYFFNYVVYMYTYTCIQSTNAFTSYCIRISYMHTHTHNYCLNAVHSRYTHNNAVTVHCIRKVTKHEYIHRVTHMHALNPCIDEDQGIVVHVHCKYHKTLVRTCSDSHACPYALNMKINGSCYMYILYTERERWDETRYLANLCCARLTLPASTSYLAC